MSLDDDLTESVIADDPYERARAMVRQTITLRVHEKIKVALGVLFCAVLLWPLVRFRQDLIQSLEGTSSYRLGIGVLVGLGVVITFCAGLLLVRQYYIIQTRDLDIEEAKFLVHMEDMFTWFLLLGAAAVVLPVVGAAIGAAFPGVTERLYEIGVRLYRISERFPIDSRYSASLGGFLGGVLAALFLGVGSRRGEG